MDEFTFEMASAIVDEIETDETDCESEESWDDNKEWAYQNNKVWCPEDYCLEGEEERDTDDAHIVLSYVICGACRHTVPLHTIEIHLNKFHPIHQCPHDARP